MDILTPLYRKGGLLFLLDEYISFAADKIRGGGGGGGDLRYHSDLFPTFRFFHIHLDLLLLESGRSADICVP